MPEVCAGGLAEVSEDPPDLSPNIPPAFCARKFCPGGIIVPEVAELHAGYYAHDLRPQIVRHGTIASKEHQEGVRCVLRPYFVIVAQLHENYERIA